MALRVQDQSDEVREMSTQWPIVEALLGGTPAMRKAATELLPTFPNEEPKAYESRLGVSTLYPALRRTVSVMAGKPFSKALTLADDVPARVKEYTDNVDLQGRNLHMFAHRIAREALSFGICGVLVDYPKTPAAATQADVRSIGARPYAVFYKHDAILGWKSAAFDGQIRLTQLRLAEVAHVESGPYGTAPVNRVRVLFRGGWELHQEFKPGEYQLVDSGLTSVDEIPFVPYYGEQTGFMTGKSPLLDLAYLNVKHWQSQSDQDNITHVARVPILFGKGLETNAEITVGSADAVKATNPNADLKFVEHTGKAIESGRTSLQDLEQQMVQTGAELLVVKPGTRSATEANNDAEGNKSDLQVIGEGWEDSLDQTLQFMAEFSGEASGGHVSLFKDYGAATLTDASAQLILSMQQGGLITKATAIREQQRRGTLAADIDPEEELELAALDGPALGAMGPDGEPLDPNDPAALDRLEGEGGREAPEGGGAPGAAGGAPAARSGGAAPAPLDPKALAKAFADAIAPLVPKPIEPAALEAAEPLDVEALAKAVGVSVAASLAPVLEALAKPIAPAPVQDLTPVLQAVTTLAEAFSKAPRPEPMDFAALAKAIAEAMPEPLDPEALGQSIAAALPKPTTAAGIDFIEQDGKVVGARITKEGTA
jgi:hypothetical protein